MHDTLPLLRQTDFPCLSRRSLDILQVNLGYRCNQTCVHCHVNAGPHRLENMSRETAEQVLELARARGPHTVDITGGAPELHDQFRFLVRGARELGVKEILDRCNLTILEEPGQEDLAEFLAGHQVTIVASLPCYLEANVDSQRGNGVFRVSIRSLRRLNALGYGRPDSGLTLNLVYNPQGAALPPPQDALQTAYKTHLKSEHGVEFNQLFTITNMPIQRFGSALVSQGRFNDYMALLKASHQEANLESVMCRDLVSVDWQGWVYDCDFNQLLGLPLRVNGNGRVHARDIATMDLSGTPIMVADHCYGCTAGQGSSCGGALD